MSELGVVLQGLPMVLVGAFREVGERLPAEVDAAGRDPGCRASRGLGRPAARAHEISPHLHIGEGAVKTHWAAILRKLDVRDRTQAAVMAYELGLVRPGG